MIEIKNLTKKFDSFTAVDNISFAISKGEIVGFLGPNGAGKTTTMRILTGFWPATAGQVTIGNLDILKDSLKIRQKIGYLPENTPLYEEMSVLEYLEYAALMKNIPKDKISQRIEAVIADCGLREKKNKDILTLSKGYRQRVGLAQALLSDPEILILDEPTSGLDPNQIIEIRELIKKIGREKTVILSSHILPEVEATCDRVLIINQGKIVATGTPAELKEQTGRGGVIKVKIEFQPGRDVAEDLRGLPGVLDVKKHPEGQIMNLEIKVSPDRDLRKELARFLIDRSWGLLEIYQEEASLESVFGELTGHQN